MFSHREGSPDAPSLVCLHGGTGTGHYHWSKVVKVLSSTRAVHLPDLPGHGRTPLPVDRPYGRDVLVDAIAGYLQELGPPVDVAAFSMGGHACLALAQQRPDLFASLTLIGVSVKDHAGLTAWRARFDPDVLQREVPLWARHLSRLHAPLGGPDAWRDVCRRDSGGMAVDVAVHRLSGLVCPVLLIRGDRDPAVEPGQYAALRAVWGDRAEEFVVPGGGHDVQLTRHRLVGPGMADFYARLDRRRAGQ